METVVRKVPQDYAVLRVHRDRKEQMETVVHKVLQVYKALRVLRDR